MKNVLEWLERTCELCGEKIGYSDTEGELSFNDLCHTAMQIGTELAKIKERAPIAVLSGRNVNTISIFMGVVYSGHAYAPIDATLPRQRVDTIIDILNPSAIVADDNYFEIAKELSNDTIPVYIVSEFKKSKIDHQILSVVRRNMVKTDPLYVIFTSGSTGKPKGVITSHESLMCYIDSYTEVMNIDSNDVLGNQSPLDYIAAIRDIYIPMSKGSSMVVIPKEFFMQPEKLFKYMNEKKVSAIGWSVSAFTILSAMNVFEGDTLKYLRKICFSGSVMPILCLKEWQQNLPQAVFVNQYGPTEATASCTYYKVEHLVDDNEILPIGVPYNNYNVFLLNEDMTSTMDGDIGEICVSGPILALGYYNDIERTLSSFITVFTNGYPERIYKTGDYGKKRKDGNLEFHGRKDRQIKHMGHRVELDEIEYAANKVVGLDECVVLYEYKEEIIHLFYSGSPDKRNVVLELRKNIPGFMVPRKVHKIDKMPRLANGKIDMISLRKEM